MLLKLISFVVGVVAAFFISHPVGAIVFAFTSLFVLWWKYEVSTCHHEATLASVQTTVHNTLTHSLTPCVDFITKNLKPQFDNLICMIKHALGIGDGKPESIVHKIKFILECLRSSLSCVSSQTEPNQIALYRAHTADNRISSISTHTRTHSHIYCNCIWKLCASV